MVTSITFDSYKIGLVQIDISFLLEVQLLTSYYHFSVELEIITTRKLNKNQGSLISL